MLNIKKRKKSTSLGRSRWIDAKSKASLVCVARLSQLNSPILEGKKQTLIVSQVSYWPSLSYASLEQKLPKQTLLLLSTRSVVCSRGVLTLHAGSAYPYDLRALPLRSRSPQCWLIENVMHKTWQHSLIGWQVYNLPIYSIEKDVIILAAPGHFRNHLEKDTQIRKSECHVKKHPFSRAKQRIRVRDALFFPHKLVSLSLSVHLCLSVCVCLCLCPCPTLSLPVWLCFCLSLYPPLSGPLFASLSLFAHLRHFLPLCSTPLCLSGPLSDPLLSGRICPSVSVFLSVLSMSSVCLPLSLPPLSVPNSVWQPHCPSRSAPLSSSLYIHLSLPLSPHPLSLTLALSLSPPASPSHLSHIITP